MLSNHVMGMDVPRTYVAVDSATNADGSFSFFLGDLVDGSRQHEANYDSSFYPSFSRLVLLMLLFTCSTTGLWLGLSFGANLVSRRTTSKRISKGRCFFSTTGTTRKQQFGLFFLAYLPLMTVGGHQNSTSRNFANVSFF